MSLSSIVLALGTILLVGSCSVNSPPILQPVATPQTAFVGARLEITLLGFDADGDPLSFSYRSLGTALGSRAQVMTLAGRGVFSWAPAASDVGEHHVAFVVSDGKSEVTQAVTIVVKRGTSSNTAPVFRRPLGYGTTLDLEHQRCVDVDVLVEDPDSITVAITQDPIIADSTLSTVGALAAAFHWCPSDAQKRQLQYVLRLVADDGDHPPVTKDYMIVLRVPLPPTCPGAPPQIAHTPPSPMKTLDPIALQASVTDDLGLKGLPLIYYGTEPPPPGDVDISKLGQLKMTAKSAGYYEASLPNPLKGLPPGSKKTLYYVIVAEDDDDAGGTCDHRTQVPKGGAFSVELTAPQDTKSCASSKDCVVGKVCDGTTCVGDSCIPTDANGDGLYLEQGSCPDQHFCPQSGSLITLTSTCVPKCKDKTECGTGRECKVFSTQQGCAVSGSGEIGEGCASFEDCAGKEMCMQWAGGYCALSDCDSSGKFSGACPSGSFCYPMPDARMWGGTHWICMKGCATSSNCREVFGYECREIQDDTQTTRHVCLPKGSK